VAIRAIEGGGEQAGRGQQEERQYGVVGWVHGVGRRFWGWRLMG
jgi:hypothetical protein